MILKFTIIILFFFFLKMDFKKNIFKKKKKKKKKKSKWWGSVHSFDGGDIDLNGLKWPVKHSRRITASVSRRGKLPAKCTSGQTGTAQSLRGRTIIDNESDQIITWVSHETTTASSMKMWRQGPWFRWTNRLPMSMDTFMEAAVFIVNMRVAKKQFRWRREPLPTRRSKIS